ncbi:GH25 family lysozyme [Lactococcus lactis]|uniref:GH25 family lysozyme n=1 Tax=Lactococcus lactis TaxID=1358 RepID=UPI0017819AE3|nr:GH25 family lysozyme [Lactococcus lactis]MBD5854201.1 family 25 glycosyl hydrolase [Lactococcus lactis]
MKLKKSHIIPLILLSGLLIAKPVFAEDNVSQDDHPMGYYIKQEQEALLAQKNLPAPQTQVAPATPEDDETENTVTPTQTLPSSAIHVRMLSTAAPMLNSNTSSLPRRDAVDIASYQNWMNQADFYALKSAGVKTVVVKLTEGENYTNPYAKSQINMAKTAGLTVATYHFVSDPTRIQYEAAYYAKTAKSLGLSSNTVMIEDAEAPSTAYNWTNVSIVFKNTMASHGFHNIRYYTSQSWITSGVINTSTLGAKNMWVAQYPPGTPSTYAAMWKNSNTTNSAYGAWQYTSEMRFQGTSNLKSNNLDTSIDYNNIFIGLAAGQSEVYRLYNSNNKEHLYTSDANEKNQLPKLSKDWKYEGIAWYAPTSSTTAVYRVYNSKSGEHLYTKDANEIKVLSSKYGWKKEGTAFYSGGSTPVYRLFNAAAGVGSHFVTNSLTEKNSLVSRGWKYEGVAWYAK